MRVFVAATLIVLSAASVTQGQGGSPWLVLPTSHDADVAWMTPHVESLRAALLDRGIEVWSPEAATDRFERKGSAPAIVLTDPQLADWEASAEEAVGLLADGDPARALAVLDDAQELSRTAPETLNRDPQRAKRVLDTCLYVVRGLLETGSESLAERLSRECRRLVSGGVPSARLHPPKVLETLARVDAERAEQTGLLLVESEPPGCPVRVNGISEGETPLTLEELFPGRYRVQVECEPGQVGRVHVADVGFTRTDLFVDARFDDVVRTQPLLRLQYPDAAQQSQHDLWDAVRVSGVLPTRALLLLRQTGESEFEVRALRGVPLAPATRVRFSASETGPQPDVAASVAGALIDGACVDLTSGMAQPIPCEPEPEPVATLEEERVRDWPPTRMPRGMFISGLTLIAAGGASLFSGYVMIGPRATAAEEWVSLVDSGGDSLSKQQQWLNLGSAINYLGAGGAAALVAGLPLALPKRDNPPWWAWMSGGLGLGLAAFSIAYGVSADSEPAIGCSSSQVDSSESRICVRREERVNLAVLTGVTAAPALTVPLVYLFRRKDKRFVPEVRLGAGAAYLGVQGSF